MSTDRQKPLCIGLSLSATWLRPHNQPADRVAGATDIYSADFYIALAKRAQAAYMDFVFKPDSLSLLNLQASAGDGYSKGIQPVGHLDPTIIAAAIATHTEHIGIVTTISTTFNEPFNTARQLMSLNWISQGRIGWNVVTSLDGQQNFGLDKMPATEVRYARATEFVTVVKQLWQSFVIKHSAAQHRISEHKSTKDDSARQQSWAGSAEQIQMQITNIDHVGHYFNVAGPLNLPAYPEAEIAIFQAGASIDGKRFAAAVADAVFAATPTVTSAIQLRSQLHELAGQRQRPPKLLPGLYFFIGDSAEQAHSAYLRAHAHLDMPARLDKVRTIIGVDLRHKALSDSISVEDLACPQVATADATKAHSHQQADRRQPPPRSQTHAQLLRDYIEHNTPTLAQLLARPEVISSGHWTICGTGQQVAEEIIAWAEQQAIDGFIALPGDSESLQRLFSEVMPYLQRRGYGRSSYTQASFVERIRQR